jgi:ATP-dependent 26S proteasome regulatory subunit
VFRDELILPEKTLGILDSNVEGFISTRQAIKHMGFSGKKGLLLYGPPGTGKTHTIHYLASQLPGHTTLVIDSDALRNHVRTYFELARFLQPSMIVIEDVDLIATARRGVMGGSGAEMVLNTLLNEMDGLRADADVFVILTTNAPETLEPALAARPGRIDQTIEFILPDDSCRRRLVTLYAGSLEVSADILSDVVARTAGASPAFIKELMRRCAQYHVETGGAGALRGEAIDNAMDQMLFQGGKLNLKLLGGDGIGFSAGAQG